MTAAYEEISEIWSEGRGWILVTISAGWLLLIGGQLVFPVVLPHIRAEFGISLTTAGLLLTAQWGAYALLQFPGGILGDRLGERNILVMSISIGLTGIGLIFLSPNFSVLAIGAVMLGAGSGLYGTSRFTTLMDIYPKRNGTALGISSAISNGGMAAIPLGGGFVAILLGWRGSFGVLIPFFVLITIGLWILVPRVTSDGDRIESLLTREPWEKIGSHILARDVILATSTMFLVMFLYQGFTSFFPTYLSSVKDFSESTATLMFGLFFASAIIIQPLAGVLADRFGPKPTMIGLSSVVGFAAILFPVAGSLHVVFILTIGISLLLGFMPVSFTYVIDYLPVETQGSSFGLLRTVYLTFAATGPSLIGYFGNMGRFDISFAILGVAAFITMAISISLAGTN